MFYFSKLCFTDGTIAAEYKIIEISAFFFVSGRLKRKRIYPIHERASFMGKNRDKYRENRGLRCSRINDGGSLFSRDSFWLKRYT